MSISLKKKNNIKIWKREYLLKRLVIKARKRFVKNYKLFLKRQILKTKYLLDKLQKYLFLKKIDLKVLTNKKQKRYINYNIKNLLYLYKKKPTTPSKRHLKYFLRHRILKKNRPLKSKLFVLNKSIGKNNYGQLVGYHREVGLKRRYRLVTNYRLSVINQGIIEQLEYNPNHSCILARVYNPLLNYHFYIRSPYNLKIGLYIKTNVNRECLVGDSNTLYKLLANRPIHNLNLENRNNIARSAGSFATILQKYKNYSLVQFPSKIKLYVKTNTQATFGRLSNIQKTLGVLGKAGRNRWLGCRPHVRGVAMNPIDHPHGGGQGKTSGGQPSVSAWGKPTKQIKSRPYFKHSINKETSSGLVSAKLSKKTRRNNLKRAELYKDAQRKKAERKKKQFFRSVFKGVW